MKLSNPAYFTNIFSKGIGLMFRKKITRPYVFAFKKEKIIPLHMWFVFTAIDVAFLDKNKKVVEIATLKPFTFYTPKNKAKYVVEMPKGSNKKIKLNQQIEF